VDYMDAEVVRMKRVCYIGKLEEIGPIRATGGDRTGLVMSQ
jgi:hypothetical protein